MGTESVIEVVAALVVGPDGRTLLVRKRGTQAFMNPGGKPEPGESHTETLIRELDEEIGVRPETMRPLGTFHTVAANEPGHDLIAHCFEVRLDESDHVVAAEIEESRWVDPEADLGEEIVLAPLAKEFLLPLLTARR